MRGRWQGHASALRRGRLPELVPRPDVAQPAGPGRDADGGVGGGGGRRVAAQGRLGPGRQPARGVRDAREGGGGRAADAHGGGPAAGGDCGREGAVPAVGAAAELRRLRRRLRAPLLRRLLRRHGPRDRRRLLHGLHVLAGRQVRHGAVPRVHLRIHDRAAQPRARDLRVAERAVLLRRDARRARVAVPRAVDHQLGHRGRGPVTHLRHRPHVPRPHDRALDGLRPRARLARRQPRQPPHDVGLQESRRGPVVHPGARVPWRVLLVRRPAQHEQAPDAGRHDRAAHQLPDGDVLAGRVRQRRGDGGVGRGRRPVRQLYRVRDQASWLQQRRRRHPLPRAGVHGRARRRGDRGQRLRQRHAVRSRHAADGAEHHHRPRARTRDDCAAARRRRPQNLPLVHAARRPSEPHRAHAFEPPRCAPGGSAGHQDRVSGNARAAALSMRSFRPAGVVGAANTGRRDRQKAPLCEAFGVYTVQHRHSRRSYRQWSPPSSR
mmetsp:Transcript_6356/g.22688  ORF Transcript_6356/g.22688 Transcript_6356/m.22688 type:complete len:492 (-) Transcript_6356:555-2030(-)